LVSTGVGPAIRPADRRQAEHVGQHRAAGLAGREVADGQVRPGLVERREGRPDPERVEEALLDDRAVRAAGQVLDHQAKQDEPGAAVGERGGSRPCRHPRHQGQEVGHLAEALRASSVEHAREHVDVTLVLVLLEVVAEPRGVGEQVADGHVGGQPGRALLGGQQLDDRGAELEATLGDESRDHAGREHLGERRDAEPSALGDRSPVRPLGEPEAPGVDDVVALPDHDLAREARALRDVGHRVVGEAPGHGVLLRSARHEAMELLCGKSIKISTRRPMKRMTGGPIEVMASEEQCLA
jgi:hypothetical protein